MNSTFADFPDSSRLWVFPLTSSLKDVATFKQELEKFVLNWKAHGAPLKAAVEILDCQIAIVVADESSAASASGCSIDALSREVARLSSAQGLAILGGADVLFKGGAGWQAVSRGKLQELIGAGLVTSQTIVTDATISSVGEFRTKGVVKSCADSWHAQVFNFKSEGTL